MTRLSHRIETAAREMAAAINAGHIACATPEQTAELRSHTCDLLMWAQDVQVLEGMALVAITGRRAVA